MSQLNFGMFPVALLVAGLLIPLAYSAVWKRRELHSMAMLFGSGALIVLLYPLTSFLPGVLGRAGYPLGKLLLFVILPMGIIYYIERWEVREILAKAGVSRENLWKSVLLGLGAAVVTITITCMLSSATGVDLIWSTITFFESFTEEFYFRGVLILYLMRKTNIRVAYLTSVVSFVLIHPQHFTRLFILATAAQGILMGIVAYRTRNIVGPWIGHGLNRIVPIMVRTALAA